MRGLILILTLAAAINSLSEILESSSVSSLVSRSLPDVQAAVEAYYKAQSRTSGAWGYNSTSLTNSAGEVGVRFRICNCTSIPVCYEVHATSVSSNTTRLKAGPVTDLPEARDEFREFHVKRARRILTGVMDALESKP